MSTEGSCKLHQQEHNSSEDKEEEQHASEQEGEWQQGGDQDVCWSERNYQDSRNEKKVLYLMCTGLNNDNGSPLLFWVLIIGLCFQYLHFVLKNNDYLKEIARRSNDYNTQPIPRPRDWTRQQIIELLDQNPNCEPPTDIAFLNKEMQRVC